MKTIQTITNAAKSVKNQVNDQKRGFFATAFLCVEAASSDSIFAELMKGAGVPFNESRSVLKDWLKNNMQGLCTGYLAGTNEKGEAIWKHIAWSKKEAEALFVPEAVALADVLRGVNVEAVDVEQTPIPVSDEDKRKRCHITRKRSVTVWVDDSNDGESRTAHKETRQITEYLAESSVYTFGEIWEAFLRVIGYYKLLDAAKAEALKESQAKAVAREQEKQKAQEAKIADLEAKLKKAKEDSKKQAQKVKEAAKK